MIKVLQLQSVCLTQHNCCRGLVKSKDALADLRKKKQIQSEVKGFFDELLVERANRLVIIVDELDRCKPNMQCGWERVKHYFADDRISFVFSTNIKELQHTISNFMEKGLML